jgi:endonuclease YncB( thermonuclease family)
MTSQLLRHPRIGRCVQVVAACLTLALIVHAQDSSPPLPAHDFDQTPAYAVVRVNAQCGVSVRLEARERTLILAGVTVPRGEQARAQLRQFLEHLLVNESVYIRPESAVSDPQSPTDHAEVCLFRVPDGLLVNLEAVRQGYAKVRAEPPCEHLEVLRHYEQRAREAKKGVWAPPSSRDQQSAIPSSRPATTEAAPKAEDITVYVTRTGTKYHREGCQHLQKSSRAITLKEALDKGYEPCSRCKPPTLEDP